MVNFEIELHSMEIIGKYWQMIQHFTYMEGFYTNGSMHLYYTLNNDHPSSYVLPVQQTYQKQLAQDLKIALKSPESYDGLIYFTSACQVYSPGLNLSIMEFIASGALWWNVYLQFLPLKRMETLNSHRSYPNVCSTGLSNQRNYFI